MKRVLIASPVKGGLSPSYCRGIISTLFANFGGAYKFDVAWTSGTSVAMARDELADLVLRRGDDELIFHDVDMGPADSKTMLAMYSRLLSHDVEIVAGQYVGHNFLSQFHGAAAEDGAQPAPNGLMRMAQIPLGFSKISRTALVKIRDFHPNRQYLIKQTCDTVPTPDRFEFFPNGVVGPCSAEGKLERLKAIVKKTMTAVDVDLVQAIADILHDSRYETNYMLGEDFYFCKLAREAGVPLYIDNNLIVPHDTGVRLPVTNEMLLKALMEHWRWEDNTKPEEMASLVDTLGMKLGPNHL